MKVLQRNGEMTEVGFEEKEGKKAFWHTSAHVLAQAVKRLYPDTKCAIGPAIESGFFYDFEFSFPFSESHLKKVEEEMRKIVSESLSLQVYGLSRQEAAVRMAEKKEPYKLEMINALEESVPISFYRQGDYEEFCAGPHISNTSQIKALKLLSVAGEQEQQNQTVSVRKRDSESGIPEQKQMTPDCFVKIMSSQAE